MEYLYFQVIILTLVTIKKKYLKEWRNFNKVLERAKIACENSGFDVESDLEK